MPFEVRSTKYRMMSAETLYRSAAVGRRFAGPTLRASGGFGERGVALAERFQQAGQRDDGVADGRGIAKPVVTRIASAQFPIPNA